MVLVFWNAKHLARIAIFRNHGRRPIFRLADSRRQKPGTKLHKVLSISLARRIPRLCHNPVSEVVHGDHLVTLAGAGHLKGRAYGYSALSRSLGRANSAFGADQISMF